MALVPGRDRLSTQPPPTGSIVVHEHDRHGAACLLKRAHDRPGGSQDDIRRERDQFRSVSAKAIEIAGAPAVFDPHVAADDPAQFGQPLRERRDVF